MIDHAQVKSWCDTLYGVARSEWLKHNYLVGWSPKLIAS